MSEENIHLGEDKLRRYLRKVTSDLREARRHIDEMEQREREPIAIVGMACRYPGGVASPEDLWRLVDSETDAIGEFPTDRGWDVERLYDPDPDHAGTTYSRHGGFLHDCGEFDADFFAIGPREALAMDPQQRILLECAWETFEDAGIDPSSLVGSQTGVFAGVMHNDYGVGAGAALEELEGYRATGIEDSVISGRLAYTFGLEGPAISLDTACSSSLVTIHLASQALRLGECELALAGGVTVFATPTAFIEFSRQRGLAADGRCKSFSAGANGIGWSEGVGLVMLERLSQAHRNGHRVLALVRGSAVNQDGASNGLTAPNGPSQERVIRQALASAGLSPAEIDAVEAHGTGTPLGDPIEAQALLATYGQGRPQGRPLWLGALKSNIGHSAAAAGVAGVIKTVQAMRHGKLPKTLHAQERSPHVDWSEGDISLLTQAMPWEANGTPRRAGVSSFGVSGTNAHIILEEAPRIEEATEGAGGTGGDGGGDALAGRPSTTSAEPVDRSGVAPFLVSGFGEEALIGQAGRLRAFVEAESGLDRHRVGCELALRRGSLSHRGVIIAEDRQELIEGLAALEGGLEWDGVVSGVVGGGRLAFLFSGQGSQWVGMGRGLYEVFPVFAGELDLLCGELDPLLGCSLRELLFAEEGSEGASVLDRTEFTQPALFALEVALYRLVAGFGLKPDFLVGHSIGELAAAYVAGVFSLEDACRLVVGRGRLMGALDGVGAMAAVRASERDVLESLTGFGDRLALAAVNAPEAVVVSGDEVALGEWEAVFGAAGDGVERKITRLRVSNAFHSALMDPMLEEFRTLAEDISFSEPTIPIVSNVTGAVASGEFCSAEYWVSQVRGTVRFADDVRALRDVGVTRFLELGPDGVLSGMVLECFGEEETESGDVLVAASLRKRRVQARAFLSFLAQAHAHGVDVDWNAFFDAKGAERVALPTYAFQRRRYWLASGAGVTDAGTLGQASADHPLLGAALHLAGEEDAWLLTGRLSLATHPWLRDHAVMGTVLMPGTGFVELALAAGQHVGSEMVEELTLQAPLLLSDDNAVQLQITVSAPDEEGHRQLTIYSRPQDASGELEWICHASGALCSPEDQSDIQPPELWEQWPPSGAQELDIGEFYERLAQAGYNYGPSFQGMRKVFGSGDDLFAEIALAEEPASEAQSFCAHPALSDAALHPALLAAEQEGEVGVPFAFSGVRLLGRGATALRLRLTVDPQNAGTLSLFAADEHDEPVISIQSLQTRAVDQSQLQAAKDASNDSLYELGWIELPLAGADDALASPVVLGDAEKLMSPGIELQSYADLAELESAVEQGSSVPEVVLVSAATMVHGGGSEGLELTDTIHQTAERTLELLQGWIASGSLSEAKLVLVTDAAMAAAKEEAPNLDQAALVGMMNSAQSEHPGRFGVIDLDASDVSRLSLYNALTIDEPRLAIREGSLYAPRFVRLKAREQEPPEPFDTDGTVLITGGTGGLGALVARHLVTERGASSLLLVSRSGLQASGAQELRDSLSELGCEVRVAACDVSDRPQLQELLDSISPEHPLTMVVHAAGVLDDSLIELMDGERLKRVMAPKINAAVHLHELTMQTGLREFILFSSAVAPMGSPGQSNYAAANGFLDALAAHRHAMGLPALSLGWGAWEQSTGMTGTLSESDRARLERFGIASLSDEHGLEMLDRARGIGEPLLMPVPLDVVALRALAKTGMLPAVLRGLVRIPTRQASDAGGSLARRLAAAPESEWEDIVAALVREHVAGVLGHTSAEAIDPQRAFKDLGFDSLAAVELRNRLNQDTGLKLPSTLVFDHPTSVAVAEFVRSKVEGAKREVKVLRRSATQNDEPIAIVGMSCRYPGGVSSPQELWELVASGRDAISEFPEDRGWGAERLYDPDPDAPGTTYTRQGGFVYDAGDFDAEFFGISPREALAMDPQQRLLLEGAWEVFENAGIAPASLAGSETGVFAGVMYQDYGLNVGSVSAEVEGYIGTGNAGSVVSGRLAYTFGLEGPAVTFNTACSSSLVALHAACQALRSGECSLALAGGVTVLVTPGVFVAFARQRGLAVDGRCKSFGAGADGTGWSEGMGLLLLERLSDAERSGHEVLAVVRGAAVNQDGASNGLTAPNGPSQQRVIGQALASVGLSPAEVDAVEAHGTGTSLGDPIEAQALLATYGQDRPEGRPLWLGSIKSNMGHTQAAAGVAGVIKMVMAMRHCLLPKTLHAEEPSPLIDWSEGDVELLREPVAWERNGKPRRAGVSSFGISGTNAHVILEEAPPGARKDTKGSDDGDPDEVSDAPPAARSEASPFLVSAANAEALIGQAGRLRAFVEAESGLDRHRVGCELALRRGSLSHRGVVIAEDRQELIEGLAALEGGLEWDGVVSGVVGGGRLAFLFSGQGSQWVGMGRGLYEVFPVFAGELDLLCGELDPLLGCSLRELLFAEEGSEGASVLDRTEFTQPALFALEVALYRLVAGFGLKPDFLVGHSIGELAAAYVAGVFSLEDACRLVVGRGRLMGALDGVGAMAAVRASERDVLESLTGFGDRLALAAVNAPEAVVVSGDEVALGEWEAVFGAAGDGVERKITRLRVSNAFHSALMDPMLEEFRTLAEDISFSEPTIPIVSNVTGAVASGEFCSAEYWVSQVRGTVRFADDVRALRDVGVTRFLELGPDGVLSGMVLECFGEEETESGDVLVAASLRKRRVQARAFLSFLAQAHAHGVDVDWNAFFDAKGAERVALPTYAFQRRRYWLASGAGVTDAGTLGQASADHPLLGAALHLAGEEDAWLLTGRLSLATHPWLRDHAVMGTVLMPGTGFVELALAAGQHVGSEMVEELTLQAPLLLSDDDAVQLQITVSAPDEEGHRQLTIYSRPQDASGDASDDDWIGHASGVLGSGAAMGGPDTAGLGMAEEWPPPGSEELDSEYFYDRLAEAGYGYGPAFRGLRRVFGKGEDLFAEVELPGEDLMSDAQSYCVHPALSDAALHAVLLSADRLADVEVPFAFAGVRLFGRGAGALRVRLAGDGEGSISSLIAVDELGDPVLSIEGVQSRAIDRGRLQAVGGPGHDALHGVEWVELPVPSVDGSAQNTALLGDGASAWHAKLGRSIASYSELSALKDAIEAGGPAPEMVLVEVDRMVAEASGAEGETREGGEADAGALAERVHRSARRLLALLQEWISSEDQPDTRLVFVTERALAAAASDSPNLYQAALVGLVRSAQSEHPERFKLIDLDQSAASAGALEGALALAEDELAIRQGSVLAPRLARLSLDRDEERSFDCTGTVLITGGTGGLGALMAHHLASEHGARRLLLVSRSGAHAAGVETLRDSLSELGCEVQIAACDVADRDQLRELFASISPEHPLTAVVHAAGVIEDSLLETLDPDSLARVLAPKVDAAINLHELTRHTGLSEFVLFSSIAASMGSPGQANYAAANAFLDALAARRRAEGLPGVSLAWSAWDRATGMTGGLGEADRARLERVGIVPLSDEQGLELFDIAAVAERSLVLPVRLDMDALRTQAKAGMLPMVLSGLVRVPTRQAGRAGSSLEKRLEGSPQSEWDGIILEIVRGYVAGVLGYASSGEVDPNRAFKDLGFDSLAAVELRNRLGQATEVKLPSTLVFDYPTTIAIAGYLRSTVEGVKHGAPAVRRSPKGADEPIAIVGMSCRYPGGVSSPQDLWELVAEGRDVIGEFPSDRGWDVERLYNPDPDHGGTSYTRRGGFLYDAAEFDAEFFSISPREALAMDPQQRLLLEASWEAFEDAGVDPTSLRGSQTGVFTGVMYGDYGRNAGSVPAELEGYLGTGSTGSVISGRLAYTFGLEGPAMTVDTACSSSLVAMHLALQALRSGECELALAGGVTVLSSPDFFISFSRQRNLSVDGRCKSFGAGADGAGFSEGMGLLLLERLSDAERAGHEVLAVVRGSAVNQDGASNGLTAPNGPSQQRVIGQALASVGLSTVDVDAIEAHGTGTSLGDPIEAQALLATYGQDRPEGQPLWLGSIKSNMGHTQAAAGVAGVIKMVMAMRHGVLPKTLHADEPSPLIDWSQGDVELLKKPVAWERNGKPRRAGVSSFGISGTNAHVILEEAPVSVVGDVASGGVGEDAGEEPGPAHAARIGVVPYLVSASSDDALEGQAGRLRSFVEGSPDVELRGVGAALAMRRSVLSHRAVVLADGREGLLASLRALERGEVTESVVRGVARGAGRVAFLFPGQGAQWIGMGIGLWESAPVFAEQMQLCAEAFGSYFDWSLEDVLRGGDGAPSLERVDVVQPALFSVMVSLAALWRSFGVEPAAVLGHSQGEIAAAYVAGGLSLDDAARVVASRSSVAAEELSERGGMVSVALPSGQVEGELERWGERVSVAVVNGPASVVVAGENEALDELLAHYEAQGVRSRRIPAAFASHSAQVERIKERLLGELASLAPRAGEIPFYSATACKQIDTAGLDGDYWYANLRETVRFYEATRVLLGDAVTTFVEMSPHPMLTVSVEEAIEAQEIDRQTVAVLGSLKRERGDLDDFVLSLAKAHAAGVDVDWSSFFDARDAERVTLPTYAFQRRRYWLASETGVADASALGQSVTDHPLLGAALHLADAEDDWLFTGRLSLATHPWLRDHAVMGTVLMPGTGFVELALAAGQHVGSEMVEELTLQAPLLLSDDDAVQLQITVSAPDEAGHRQLTIYSRPQDASGDASDDDWIGHASGVLGSGAAMGGPDTAGLGMAEEWPPPGSEELDSEYFYDRLAEAGYGYGPVFQGLRRVFREGEDLFAEVELDEDHRSEAQAFCIHPALSDSALHAVLLSADRLAEIEVPFAFSGVRLFARGAGILRVHLAGDGEGSISSLRAVDELGDPVFSIQGMQARIIDQSQLRSAARGGADDGLHQIEWVELSVPSADGSMLSVAAVGASTQRLFSVGIELECYPDLATLKDAIAGGASTPEIVLVEAAGVLAEARGAEEGSGGIVQDEGQALRESVHLGTHRMLELLQEWSVSEGLSDARLVLVTDRAVGAVEGDRPNLTEAALVGLMRSAQSEHPGRFGVIDLDESTVSAEMLQGALSLRETELAIRRETIRAPRLARLARGDREGESFDCTGTVLITGGTSGLGALMAQHLAAEHGAKRLLLVSRSGPEAAGVQELCDSLSELGCEARVAGCDVADREQLRELIDTIPQEYSLTGVIHAAGVLDDGLIESLDADRLSRVLAPKVDAAINLHELTQQAELSEFVLFSSIAASMGSPGQGNYAAANAFLDALAANRRADGLPGVSLAWGAWDRATIMTASLTESDRARFERIGILPLSDEQGLELFDLACGVEEALVLPVRLNMSTLRAQAKAGMLPTVLRGLVRVPTRQASDAGGSLARRLESAPESEWNSIILDLVRGHVAGVLGYDSPGEVDPGRAFKELGFDSLAAVELRNRLSQATGLQLPSTLVFDHPTPTIVAGFVRSKVEGVKHGVSVVRRSVARDGEPVAIVGMSCRFPGGVSSPRELWELIASGGDAISVFPEDRGWGVERLYDADPETPGTTYTRHGGFVYDAGDFDAEFFGIGPREALAMDPQQRLLLEGAWEAFEDAGILPGSLAGSDTGVFAGVMYQDYGLNPGPVSAELEGYLGTGNAGSVISGRVAYVYGLEGPAMTVDTACSSSLVALHSACLALRAGECSLALAGGVTVLSRPTVYTYFARQRGLSVDGRCKSFGAGADGAGFSEGMGLLLLERLSDAERAGHEVLAVVRGSAVNQDGASNGLTAPNGPSQQRVIGQALGSVGLSPGEVDVVEAHGTGTSLGDPIEAQALLATYGQDRPEGRPLWLGSVKSNLGHTQAAAGVAGVIKMVMALRNGVLPKTLHADEPSPLIDWSEGDVELLHESVAWERNGKPRRAGVSSFGISGTNAHVILEEAPVDVANDAASAGVVGGVASGRVGEDAGEEGSPLGVTGVGVVPYLVSASSDRALEGQAGRLRSFVEGSPDVELRGVGAALAMRRSVLSHRAVVLADGREGLLASLRALERGEVTESVVRGVARGAGRAAFLFSGQGSQWVGMGKELWESAPVFAEQMQLCAEAFGSYFDWSLEDVLRGGDGAPSLERVDVVQPALFSVMVSLAALWRSFGVEPAVVLGHSQGEIAAAYVAGGLSLDDAVRVVASRSTAVAEELSGRGGMVSVALPSGQVEGELERWGERVSVAVVNGPASVVVAGENEALDELLAHYEAQGVRSRRIPVDYASHSAQVERIKERLLGELASLAPRAGEIPFYSATACKQIDTAGLDGDYWYANLRETVRFYEATRVLLGDAVTTFVEMSPHPMLTVSVEEAIEAQEIDRQTVAVLGSLKRGQGGRDDFVRSLAQAHAAGVEVDWSSFFDGRDAAGVTLPTYAFQRRRYWLRSASAVTDASALGQSIAEHPLLGAALHLAGEEDAWLFTGRFSGESHPWLKDHAVMDSMLMPGTGFLELALAAGEYVGSEMVEELTLQAPLLLAGDEAVQLQITVSEPDPEGRREIEIYARPDDSSGDTHMGGEWTCHAAGVLCTDASAPVTGPVGSVGDDRWPPVDAEELDSEYFYDRLAEAGYGYGPVFQGLRRVFREGEDLFAEVELDEDHRSEAQAFCIHPALSDSALHAVLLSADRLAEIEVPFAFSGVRLFARGAGILRVHLAGDGEGSISSLRAVDELGDPVFSIQGMQARIIDQSQLRSAARGGADDGLHQIEWVELSVPSADGSMLSVAAVGASTQRLFSVGIELECYPDLATLKDAIAGGASTPEIVLVEAAGVLAEARGAEEGSGGIVQDEGQALRESVHLGTHRMLELLQEWSVSEGLSDARLVLVTDRAVGAVEGDRPNLTEAALVGLMRSAQSEHPGRFGVIDLDESTVSAEMLQGALSLRETELAIRRETIRAPRLARLARGDREGESFDCTGTVLITGGTSGLGALMAQHLAAEHGAKRLLLVSRSGPEAAGVQELCDSLSELGCEARVAGCDVADREQLRELIDTIPQEYSLTGVIHAAGVLDDGLIESLDADRLSRVLAPKVDAAINLHELTQQAELSEFVLFSSIAASMGSPGQGNYAAANAFLDALAANRRADGLPGVSLAWGAWDRATIMTASLTESDRARFERIGILPLSDEQGLELFDLACGVEEALVLPVRLNMSTLRAQAKAGMLPTVLRGLVRVPTRQASDAGGSLARRLESAPESEWNSIILDLVRGHVAGVLGYDSPGEVDPGRAFKELGFDSLAAVELRNRLSQATGLQLPSTLVFDHPTPTIVAEHIRTKVALSGVGAPAIDTQLDKLEAALALLTEDAGERGRIKGRLQGLTRRVQSLLAEDSYVLATVGADAEDALESATDDEVFELLDKRRDDLGYADDEKDPQ